MKIETIYESMGLGTFYVVALLNKYRNVAKLGYIGTDENLAVYLLNLNVNNHSIGEKWYRSSYAECKEHLEMQIRDLVFAIDNA